MLGNAPLQYRLRISQPGDHFEREADATANRVVNGQPAPPITPLQGHLALRQEEEEETAQAKLVQRQGMEEEEILQAHAMEEEEEAMQAKCACGGGPGCTCGENDTGEAPIQRASAPTIAQATQGGQPLAPHIRARLEPRFGADFRQVRIHTSDTADQSARALNALAYTRGNDIVFRKGAYAPESVAGQRLLAHELTHVVQQGGGSRAVQQHTLQRKVVDARVSCHTTPRTYPIFTVIGTTDPVGIIRAADSRAITLLTNVIEELTHIRNAIRGGEEPNWPLISDGLAIAMRRYLRLNPDNAAVWRGTGPGTVFRVIRWLRNIRRTLQGGWLRYTCIGPDCAANDWAYTYVGVSRVYLCRRFWSDTLDNQALTLIHEVSHIYYGTEDVGGGIGNAHCLEQFLTEANGLTITPDLIGSCRT